MHWMEIEERQQLAEELAARGLCLEEGREWFEVGLVLGLNLMPSERCSPQVRCRPCARIHLKDQGESSRTLARCGQRRRGAKLAKLFPCLRARASGQRKSRRKP